MENERILEKVRKLINLYKAGKLGGEFMPEDSNPKLEKSSDENYLYFTLPMALNYQRNSYKLWEAALATWNDPETQSVFNPREVVKMDAETLREKLTKYKVALQPNKQPEIWRTLCETLVNKFNGSIKNLFGFCENNVEKVKNYILANKKNFPYLSGIKILNYWLYVIMQYTSAKFVGRNHVTIAPDTHVVQASAKLGVISHDEVKKSNVQELVVERWKQILAGSEFEPIDLHTPFWLWSRGGFVVEI